MKLGIYKHFKGKSYKVIGLALNTETREKMVLYKCLYDTPELFEEYGNKPFFVRPYDNFNEVLNKDGIKVKKFKYIGNKKYEDI